MHTTANHGVRSASSTNRLRPYSCLECRRQKKKCDREYPCINCQMKETDCVFTARKPSNRVRGSHEATNRLAQLEGMVKCLRSQVEAASWTAEADEASMSDSGTHHGRAKLFHRHNSSEGLVGGLTQEFGRLAVARGRSRYLASHSWANIDDKVTDLECLLHTQLSETLDTSSVLFPASHHDLTELHPQHAMIPVYWRVYKENFDILIKILHVPTTETLILSAAARLDSIEPSTHTLLFAVYFGAVVTLSPEECLDIFGSSKDELFSRYNLAIQQSFGRVGLLETDEFIVMQAFAIYLIALRLRCNSIGLWTLTALIVRLAQNAGLHRDGAIFGLSAFESEMRRRLWWNIRVIDSRASEDSGYDCLVQSETSNTKMPLNVNDCDLTVDMKVLPPVSSGCTDMVFSLIRFEATIAFERLHSLSMGSVGNCGKLHTAKALQSKAECIASYQDRLQDLVFKQIEPSNPFYWYSAIVSRIIVSKLWLVAYHPYLRLNVCGGISLRTRDELFSKAICVVQSQLLLYNGTPTRKWSWLCKTHAQWHAIAIILTELCKRTYGDRVEAAWRAINAILDHGSDVADATGLETNSQFSTHSQLGDLREDEYKPLNKLLAAARAARASAHSDAASSQRSFHTGDSDGADEETKLLGMAAQESDIKQFLVTDVATQPSSCLEPPWEPVVEDAFSAHIDEWTGTWK